MNPHFGPGSALIGTRMMGSGTFPLGGFELFALLGVLVLAAIVIALVVWAVTRKPRAGGAPQNTLPLAPNAEDTALAIARERLARGEIEPEQYAAIVTALRS